MDETQRGKYTFAVHDDANKLMIKDAVEELFKVTVVDVNVLTTKAKEKSRNRKRGRIQWLHLALEEGHRDGRGRRQDRVLRGGLGDAAAKLQGRPRPVGGS